MHVCIVGFLEEAKIVNQAAVAERTGVSSMLVSLCCVVLSRPELVLVDLFCVKLA